jgi:hypothetical protein
MAVPAYLIFFFLEMRRYQEFSCRFTFLPLA